MGRIILLNGVSSAGKTSLARALQSLSRVPLLRVAMDDFISMVPVGMENASEWFPAVASSRDAVPVVRIDTGKSGEVLLESMRSFARSIADAGFSLVIDDVCTSKEVKAWRAALAHHELIVVKVDAPLDVLLRREKKRGDRTIGLAREQSMRLHNGIEYDLCVDTSSNSPAESAQMVIRAIEVGADGQGMAS